MGISMHASSRHLRARETGDCPCGRASRRGRRYAPALGKWRARQRNARAAGARSQGISADRAPAFSATPPEQKPHVTPPGAGSLIGMGWLYALHARSSLARGMLWQAEYMVSAMRDQVLALACLRHGLPAREGRGVDQLPAEVTRPLEAALVRGIETVEIARALRAAAAGLLAEVRMADGSLASRLEATVLDLCGGAERQGDRFKPARRPRAGARALRERTRPMRRRGARGPPPSRPARSRTAAAGDRSSAPRAS